MENRTEQHSNGGNAAAKAAAGARAATAAAARLEDPSPEVRDAALAALRGLGTAALPALAAVLPFLGERREEYSACRVLEAIGPAAVPELLAVRADGPAAAPHALHALAHLGGCAGLSARDRAALERLVRVKLLDDLLPDEMWDFHWVAVPGGSYEAAFEALGLHDRTPATLAMGLSGRVYDEAVVARPDGTDLTVHRVFVTPEIAAGGCSSAPSWSTARTTDGWSGSPRPAGRRTTTSATATRTATTGRSPNGAGASSGPSRPTASPPGRASRCRGRSRRPRTRCGSRARSSRTPRWSRTRAPSRSGSPSTRRRSTATHP
ncbi:hypothetical protein ACFQ1I_05680 [Kitasatospora arboriphila]